MHLWEVPRTVELLWAMERLAWSQDHFARVVKILARLVQMDPGGHVANRPTESLRGLFLPWRRFSEVPDEHRLETLKMLTDSVPRAGWQLLVGAYPSISDYVTDRRPPNWRPWGQDGAPDPTEEECDAFISELERLLLDNAGADASRWANLVGIFSSLSTKTRRQAIELLSLQVADVRQHPALNILWSKLREQLHRHRSSYPNAHWAMDLQDTEALDSVYQELKPSDPVAAYAWLFDGWPDLPDPMPVDLAQEHIDFSQRDDQVIQARIAAVRAAYEDGGAFVIMGIAEAASDPSQLGASASLTFDSDLLMSLALPYVGSENPKLRELCVWNNGRIVQSVWVGSLSSKCSISLKPRTLSLAKWQPCSCLPRRTRKHGNISVPSRRWYKTSTGRRSLRFALSRGIPMKRPLQSEDSLNPIVPRSW